MASELAKRLTEAASERGTGKVITAIDSELQEVREVLELFEEEWMTPHDYEHEIEFLPKGVACDECGLSKRARALIQRLRVDGGKGE